MSKKIPEFKNEDEEREFWSKHDSTEYVDWEKAERAVPSKLKPALKTISIRLPQSMMRNSSSSPIKETCLINLF